MKLVVCSDIHLDHVTAGVRRFEELSRSLDEVVEAAIREKARLFLFLGDLTDPDAGSCVFRAVEVMQRAVIRLAQEGVSSILQAGNHDVVEDGSGDTTLSPLCALEDIGLPGSIYVVEEPSHFVFHDALNVLSCIDPTATPPPGGWTPREVCLSFLPFVASSRAYDPVVEGTRYAKGPHRLVVCGHLSLPGIPVGEESREMARGREVTFPAAEIERARSLENWPASSLTMLAGHYHRQQLFTPEGCTVPVAIPGSLARLCHSEESHAPGFLVVEA